MWKALNHSILVNESKVHIIRNCTTSSKKKYFSECECFYQCNAHAEICTTCFQVSTLKDTLVIWLKKIVFFLGFGTCTRNDNFRAFLTKKIVKYI